MSIKVALLKSGESVIADIKELISNDNICGYLFENPNVINYLEQSYWLRKPKQVR